VGTAGHSRPFVQFRSRLRVTVQHMEVVNAALVETAARKTAVGKTSHHRTISNHAIVRNAEQGLQLLYSHFSEYARRILREMYDIRPLTIVDKAHGSLRFHEIVNLGSYEAVCDHMVEHVFRTLEGQRSTRALVEKILDKTGVAISDPVMKGGLAYIEMRHLIVHNSSLVDDRFAGAYGAVFRVKAGDKLNSSLGLAKKAVRAIEALCLEIDRGLVAKGFLKTI
jgi:hypothetical protein